MEIESTTNWKKIRNMTPAAPHAYDAAFWSRYADTNESRYDAEIASRIAYTADKLHCSSILEVGCGTCIDLRMLPDRGMLVMGLDPNYNAISAASKSMPKVCLARGMITEMPFADASIDMVFTHGLLNYLDDQTLELGGREMQRVAKKYIVSCEWFEENEKMIDERSRGRNMQKRWSMWGAHVMADAQVHSSANMRETRMVIVRV